MLAYFDFLYLSYSGRIGRTAYWLGYLGLTILESAILWWVLKQSEGSFQELATLSRAQFRAMSPQILQDLVMHVLLPVGIITLLFLYPTYALATKRWHDRGKSGWWSLIVLVPIIGGFWILIELGFLGGQSGTNEYGYREGA